MPEFDCETRSGPMRPYEPGAQKSPCRPAAPMKNRVGFKPDLSRFGGLADWGRVWVGFEYGAGRICLLGVGFESDFEADPLWGGC
jgi:hypothetical protein